MTSQKESQTDSNQLSETEALRLYLERDFRAFIRYFFWVLNGSRFVWNDHHDQIVDALLRCHRHEIKRLIINIPPRYGKTEIAVIMFIAWSMAQNPKAQFIHLSFSDPLALDNSGRVRELIETEEFQELWPIQIKTDTKAKNLWRTEQRGGVKAGSARGMVTGFGAGLGEDQEGFGGALIIDDPLKPDDAESETEIRNTNRRLNNTIRSRLNNPKATPIIMIMQRLHDDDPAGFALNGGTGEEWEHLKIPVLRKDGSPLWPYRHDVEDLVAIRVADKYVWNGQYMQEPIPDEGDYFLADKVRWYDELPEHLMYYGSSDYAASDADTADYTEHAVWGICENDNVYVADWWSGQEKSDVWIDEQINLMAKYRPGLWFGEGGPIKAAIEPWLERRMRERNTHTVLRWQTHSHANYKTWMARAFQALWEQRRIYLPRDKEWAHELLRQLTRFPRGTLDDKVDCCSLFARGIASVWSPSVIEKEDNRIKLESKTGEFSIPGLFETQKESTW